MQGKRGKLEKILVIIGVTIPSILVLAVVVIFSVIFIQWLKEPYDFKDELPYYGIDLPDLDYEVTDYFYDTVLHESWWMYSVEFKEEIPRSVFGEDEFIDGVTAETSRVINIFRNSGKLKDMSSYKYCRSKVFYGKRGDQQPLCIIYDSAKGIYYFLFVSY